MSYLKISHVRKKLGEKMVLKGIDLRVKKGEIIALVGPSGSGKSTLLRLLNRLSDPDSGRISLEGEDISKIDPGKLRERVVMVFQDAVMFPGTVYDNIAFGPSLKGEVDPEFIREILVDSGLPGSYLKRSASNLSGGEKRRVSLARALAMKPEMILLDEPTAGVDPKNVEKVESTIVRISRERKLTVVWVTHDVHQARRVSDRIANLKGGKVVQVSGSSEFEWRGAY
jgi:putative ABC transport system ATP-binding protein